jgi:glycosyltransferase involved in cell wall biosynthesis
MKIVKVIHGYPMLYNAGSEVYSQTICHGLARRGHEVHVFTREEDSFRPDGAYRYDVDIDEPSVKVHLINNPRHRDRYRLNVIDQQFGRLLDEVTPDIVHIGHLNHLSTSLIYEAKKRSLPIVYTLHDYWLMCPRGQFMQMHSDDENLWAACDGQDDRKCARQCYARYFSGDETEQEQDLSYWENWVARRMTHIRDISEQVDLFISPAEYLKSRYERDFGLPVSKSIYLDYGFDRSRMNGRERVRGEPFTFGYIGTHIPAKGIHHLIKAFGLLKGDCQLRIWGRDRGQDSHALRVIADSLPEYMRQRVIWMPEYKNQQITQDVFNYTDAIVTPSIWVENSPLVIHEAQQARVPVITADAGGMGEYVGHEVNGLLYEHRNIDSLAEQMQRFVDNPEFAEKLGQRGYLFSDDGQIPAIEQHILTLEAQYKRVMV